jgi:hypothetical protein
VTPAENDNSVEGDLGADRDSTPKPCCSLITPGRWCYLPDGHEGAHEGPTPRELPSMELGPRGKR